MKKIIICGNVLYVNQVTREIQAAAEKHQTIMPSIVAETENAGRLLHLAKEEVFPMFILDKNLPAPQTNWNIQDALCLASGIRKARGESIENYGDTSKGKAIILVYSATGYTPSDRSAMDRFWAPSMYLQQGAEATDEQIVELAVAATVSNGEWTLPSVWKTLHGKFLVGAR